MKNISYSLCAFVIACCLSGLQPVSAQSVNEYLGQAPPGTAIRRFPPDNLQMLAVNGVWMWHGSPSFSPDLREVFFVKYMNVPNRPEIWYSHLVSNQWTLPLPASFGNQTVIENSPVFSPTGDTLYFYSQRTGGGGFYQSFRQSDGSWSQAQHLITIPNTGWNLSLTKSRTLYYEVTRSPGNDDIYRSQWINGNYSVPERLPDQINTLSNESAPFIDPDEEYLLFISNRPGGSGYHDLYISYRDKEGGWTQSINLGNWINSSQEDGFPRVSPEGKYLFFNTVRATSQDQGYNAYWVSAAFIDLMRPIEPDTGNRVVFYSDRDGNAEIYSMFPDGSDIKRLTSNLFTDMDATWSRDGKQIAFTSDRDGNFDIFVMNTDGSDPHKLTSTGLQAGTPDWSPDGTKILFTVSEDSFAEEGDLATINLDGSGFQILAGAGQGYGPAWTDNGSGIIFCSRRTGSFEIYLMDTDGNNLQQITSSGTDKLNARLSPNSEKIVYTQVSPDGTDSEIHLLNVDGTGDIQLTQAGKKCKSPCWSSDAKRIFFQTNRFGNQEIYQMDTDGKNQINITRNTRNDYGPNTIRKSTASGISSQAHRPGKIELLNIRPNPAEHFTLMEYTLNRAGHVDLIVVDQLGRTVKNIPGENRAEGNHQIRMDISNLASGIYTVILTTGDDLLTQKLIKK